LNSEVVFEATTQLNSTARGRGRMFRLRRADDEDDDVSNQGIKESESGTKIKGPIFNLHFKVCNMFSSHVRTREEGKSKKKETGRKERRKNKSLMDS